MTKPPAKAWFCPHMQPLAALAPSPHFIWKLLRGLMLVSMCVFISWCSPFFLIWPAAMSQRQRSEVSTPRHNSLSGKNNSLMPQSSYIVWDDSESGEAYCLDVFVVQVHCCGMWGFPPWRVFLDLCVNSRELCIMRCSVGSKGGVCTPVHICGNLQICSYDVWVWCVSGSRLQGPALHCMQWIITDSQFLCSVRIL